MTLPPAAAATLGGRCACKAAACFSCCAAKSGTSCVRSSIPRAQHVLFLGVPSPVCRKRPFTTHVDRLHPRFEGGRLPVAGAAARRPGRLRASTPATSTTTSRPGAGARAMTDSPTRVAEQRWHYGVPGAAVALMAVGGGGDAAPRTGRRARRLLARRNRPEPSGRHPLHRRGLCEPGPGGAVRLRPGRRRRTAPVGGRRRHGRRP